MYFGSSGIFVGKVANWWNFCRKWLIFLMLISYIVFVKYKGDTKTDNIAAAVFLAPNVIGFCVFIFAVYCGCCARFHGVGTDCSPKFAEMQITKKMLGFTYVNNAMEFNYPNFWKYLYNTVFLTQAVPVSIDEGLSMMRKWKAVK
jgi:hypothetical protein